jgi:hypothetical protein
VEVGVHLVKNCGCELLKGVDVELYMRDLESEAFGKSADFRLQCRDRRLDHQLLNFIAEHMDLGLEVVIVVQRYFLFQQKELLLQSRN